MPSRPPSPVALTPATVAIGVTVSPEAVCGGPTRTIVAVFRSVTSALPSGRKASPHGADRCLATTFAVAAELSPLSGDDADGDGLGKFGGAPPSSGAGGPNEQAATIAHDATSTVSAAIRWRAARFSRTGRRPVARAVATGTVTTCG
jgi:hypothetical protein